MPKFLLTEETRSMLKAPLGKLLSGHARDIYSEVAKLVSLKKPPRVIFVGDVVSRNAIAMGIRRDLMIVDNREMRRETTAFDASAARTFRVHNEPSTITMQAWAAVQEAIESGDSILVVEGEEDLLTLVAMAVAPLGSFVIYGQPDQGLVLVEVDEEARKKAHAFLEAMAKRG